jgi:Ca2+-binding EF-hand superfamily protein
MAAALRAIALLIAGAAVGFAADPSADTVRKSFAQLDANTDGQLSANEYIRRAGPRAQHLRDLKLFDFNGDQSLSAAECAAVPGLVPATHRGPLPDPFEALMEAAVESMDESYDHWDQHPDVRIDREVFVEDFTQGLVGDETRSFVIPATQADPNGDGEVSRDESREFLELQLGVRSPRRNLTIQPNGRVLNWKQFPWLDADGADQITRAEFCDKVKPNGEVLFEPGDANHDGVIDWDEFADPQWIRGHEDPVAWFCKADTDFDGLVNAAELDAAMPAWRKSRLSLHVAAFDDDGDGAWSLDEYRRSPNGNYLCSWEQKRTDTDRDRKLSFTEFLFDKANFLLLQRMYFARLDRDGDRYLDRHEFEFTVQPAHALYRWAVDGSKFERLWINEDCPNGGSPEMSPDGKTILFDDYPRRMIVAVDVTTGQHRDLCIGIMPSWSPDGKHFVCCRDEEGLGFWKVSADGADAQRLADGWAAQWSPDGTMIAFNNFTGGLGVYDLATGQSRMVLQHRDHPYEDFYWGMTWSPDSRRVAARVDRPAGQAKGTDVVSVDVVGEKPDLKVHYSTERELIHAIAWSPDGQRLVFCTRTADDNKLLPHQVPVAGGEATVLPGIDRNLLYLDSAFAFDGQWLILMAR